LSAILHHLPQFDKGKAADYLTLTIARHRNAFEITHEVEEIVVDDMPYA